MGKFITNDLELPINEKRFEHSCDVATLPLAMIQHPAEAERFTENLLMKDYDRDTALKLLHSFKLVQEINICCSLKKYEDVHDKLGILQDALETAHVSPKLMNVVKNLNALDVSGPTGAMEVKAKRAEKLCKNLVDVWINEIL